MVLVGLAHALPHHPRQNWRSALHGHGALAAPHHVLGLVTEAPLLRPHALGFVPYGDTAPRKAGALQGVRGERQLTPVGEQQQPQALVEGTGRVYGAYLPTSLSETRREMFSDGTPRLVDFQMQLERDDDGASEAVA